MPSVNVRTTTARLLHTHNYLYLYLLHIPRRCMGGMYMSYQWWRFVEQPPPAFSTHKLPIPVFSHCTYQGVVGEECTCRVVALIWFEQPYTRVASLRRHLSVAFRWFYMMSVTSLRLPLGREERKCTREQVWRNTWSNHWRFHT